jgi:hypothetical protein
MVKAAQVDGLSNGPFLYDLVDLNRQALVHLFSDLLQLLNYEYGSYVKNVHF